MALKSDGTVGCWGDNDLGQAQVPPNLNNAIAIRGMFFHSGAIKEDGSIVLWGTNADGQLTIPDDLTSTNLSNADFTNAILAGVNLINANLRKVNFSGANLRSANLVGADLTGANFDGAIINDANFTNSIGADLTGAIIQEESKFTINSSIVRSPSGNAEKIKIIFPTNRNNTYIIQSSSNLSEWRSIETNILGTGDLLERVFDLEQPSNYFRAIQD